MHPIVWNLCQWYSIFQCLTCKNFISLDEKITVAGKTKVTQDLKIHNKPCINFYDKSCPNMGFVATSEPRAIKANTNIYCSLTCFCFSLSGVEFTYSFMNNILLLLIKFIHCTDVDTGSRHMSGRRIVSWHVCRGEPRAWRGLLSHSPYLCCDMPRHRFPQ